MKTLLLIISLTLLSFGAQAGQVNGVVTGIQVSEFNAGTANAYTGILITTNPGANTSECPFGLLLIEVDGGTDFDEHAYPLLLTARAGNLPVQINYTPTATFCSVDATVLQQ